MTETEAIILTGPTASGKTALSFGLAEKYNGEIICADSMQIYKYMNIGTAKPGPEEQAKVPHHLIDIIDPWEEFSVADYVARAHETYTEILSRDRTPIFVGGTGLYITSIVEGFSFGEENEETTAVRAELNKLSETEEGYNSIYKFLRKNDPEAAETIHKNNKRRVIRATLLYKTTGLTQKERNAKTGRENSFFHGTVYSTNPDREELCKRIAERTKKMLQNGWIEETENLLSVCRKANKHLSRTASRAIGYRTIAGYLRNEITYAELEERIIIETRQYAKRQMTWLRKWPWVNWL